MFDDTPLPVWQLRLFSTHPAETHELHVEIRVATSQDAIRQLSTQLAGSSWFVDGERVQRKTGPRRYEVEEVREVPMLSSSDADAEDGLEREA